MVDLRCPKPMRLAITLGHCLTFAVYFLKLLLIFALKYHMQKNKDLPAKCLCIWDDIHKSEPLL